MDERNGEVFDHHAELFAQIGGDPDNDGFKDFMLDHSVMPSLSDGGGPSHENVWGQYHAPDIPLNEENANALIDSLVKHMPPADETPFDTIKRSLLSGSNHVDQHLSGQLLDGLHREMLDSLSKTQASDLLDHLAWNGAVTERLPQEQTAMGRLQTIDKNGNSAGKPEPQLNHFITRLSPSASVESNVHTPTTSYESVSPLSSNRTPIRSDESISPMGSGHTPLRMEESASPLAAGKTPIRVDDVASPLGPPKIKSPPKPELEPPKPDKNATARCNSASDEALTKLQSSAGVCKEKEEVAVTRTPLCDSPAAVNCDMSRVPPLTVPETNVSAQLQPVTSDIKPRKRRRKPDNQSAPSAKRRCRKKQVTIYQSSMSPDEGGIKLKIKLASAQTRPPRKKRRSRHVTSDEEADAPSPSKKGKKSVRFSGGGGDDRDTGEQSGWGNQLPPEVLQRVFQHVVDDVGSVPSLVRFSSVCRLWNSVAVKPELWQNIDLSSPFIKQKFKIDRYFRWLLENRLGRLQELNLSGWKFTNITMILSLIGAHCTEIETIGLAGWQGLQSEHLRSLLQDCPRISKLDLSDVSPESKTANSAVSLKSIIHLTQTMGERLTSLILAHNTLTCLPQIIGSLANHCPNLQVLDLSNIRRVSHTEFALNIEHLQEGCPQLRILRITNSCVTLAHVPLEAQAASPGFPNLEELSVAGHQGTESLRITSVMDDDCLERILKTSHKLRLLDVRGCTRITDSSLVRVSAWDIQHLFLSGCFVTRQSGSGLELIAQKWAHSLVEVDLAWTTVTHDLNAALMAIAEKGAESQLRVLNLCGSAVTLDPVKAVLAKCPQLESLNLQSCRGLPRGVKRLYEQEQIIELRAQLEKSSSSSPRPESGTDDNDHHHNTQHDST